MSKPPDTPPEVEGKNHAYVGNAIPWYVRLLWVGFWILGLASPPRWGPPRLKRETITPPCRPPGRPPAPTGACPCPSALGRSRGGGGAPVLLLRLPLRLGGDARARRG